LDDTLEAFMLELVTGDLDFIRARANECSFDIWEEECGYHYYTQLVQAEALSRGADWLEKTGDAARAAACRSAADALVSRLDAFWSPEDGYYRSRTDVTGGVLDKALDISVVLGVLHAGRSARTHSVLDPRAQATLTALENLFEAEYAINRERRHSLGPAMGRYARDAYYGGNPWYLATLAAAEFYFRLAIVLLSGAEMLTTSENARFRSRLIAADGRHGRGAFAATSLERGNHFMRTVQAYTPRSGDLSEQFDRTTGAQISAKHLAWSYAAFITAAASRRQAVQAIRG
jgi:glucoamylase